MIAGEREVLGIEVTPRSREAGDDNVAVRGNRERSCRISESKEIRDHFAV